MGIEYQENHHNTANTTSNDKFDGFSYRIFRGGNIDQSKAAKVDRLKNTSSGLVRFE